MTEQHDEEIILTKKNGVWTMQHYKNKEVSVNEGKELVISLMDFENPIAKTVVDGDILSKQYNSVLVKLNSDKDYKEHGCFEANNAKIKEVLKGEGLVLAFTENHMPMTEKFEQYLKNKELELSKEEG